MPKYRIISFGQYLAVLGVMVGLILLEYFLGPDPGPTWYRRCKLVLAIAETLFVSWFLLRVRVRLPSKS